MKYILIILNIIALMFNEHIIIRSAARQRKKLYSKRSNVDPIRENDVCHIMDDSG